MTVIVSSMSSKKFIKILLVVGALLFIPFIAMQFTDEVSWRATDFLMMGLLLAGALLAVDFILRKVKRKQIRVILYLIILLLFLLIWGELAVGIFGSPFAGS